MTVGEVMIGSWGPTLSKGGVTADEVAVGSCRRVSVRGRLTADEAADGSCRPWIRASIGVAGPSRAFGMGS
jgi:hypothetical protein